MSQVRKTQVAEESLLDIGVYIHQSSGSLEIALKELGRIDAKARQYANQPMMGTARPDLGESVRCFTVDSFVVIYEPADDGIYEPSIPDLAKSLAMMHWDWRSESQPGTFSSDEPICALPTEAVGIL